MRQFGGLRGLPLANSRRCSLVNQQLALAGWALAPRINDDGLHRRVDDMLFAERAREGMIKEI